MQSSSESLAAWIPLFHEFLSLLVVAIGAVFTWYTKKRAEDGKQAAAWTNGLQNAVNQALLYAQMQGDQFLQSSSIRNAAVAHGVDYLNSEVGTAKTYFGYSDAAAKVKIEGWVADRLQKASYVPPPNNVIPINAAAGGPPAVPPAAASTAAPSADPLANSAAPSADSATSSRKLVFVPSQLAAQDVSAASSPPTTTQPLS